MVKSSEELNLIVIDHGKGRDANWVLFVVHCEFMEFSLRGALIDCPGLGVECYLTVD